MLSASIRFRRFGLGARAQLLVLSSGAEPIRGGSTVSATQFPICKDLGRLRQLPERPLPEPLRSSLAKSSLAIAD